MAQLTPESVAQLAPELLAHYYPTQRSRGFPIRREIVRQSPGWHIESLPFLRHN